MAEHRCRLCTTNDLDSLAEQLAEYMYKSRTDVEIDAPWEAAGPYWHNAMRQYARATLEALRPGGHLG